MTQQYECDQSNTLENWLATCVTLINWYVETVNVNFLNMICITDSVSSLLLVSCLVWCYLAQLWQTLSTVDHCRRCAGVPSAEKAPGRLALAMMMNQSDAHSWLLLESEMHIKQNYFTLKIARQVSKPNCS